MQTASLSQAVTGVDHRVDSDTTGQRHSRDNDTDETTAQRDNRAAGSRPTGDGWVMSWEPASGWSSGEGGQEARDEEIDPTILDSRRVN